jgi:hypothetical protein
MLAVQKQPSGEIALDHGFIAVTFVASRRIRRRQVTIIAGFFRLRFLIRVEGG